MTGFGLAQSSARWMGKYPSSSATLDPPKDKESDEVVIPLTQTSHIQTRTNQESVPSSWPVPLPREWVGQVRGVLAAGR